MHLELLKSGHVSTKYKMSICSEVPQCCYYYNQFFYFSVSNSVAMLVSNSVCESLADEQILCAVSMASCVTANSSLTGTF